MPELPEVETIRRGLQAKIVNKKIVKIEIHKIKQIHGDIFEFRKKLVGNSFSKVDRVGKLLIFKLKKGNDYLLVHLKMTGQLIYKNKKNIVAGGHNLPISQELPNKYSHIILYFSDKSILFYNDLRQFGYFKIVSHLAKEEIRKKYGLEPLTKNFTLPNFLSAINKKSGVLKSVLLNQQIFSGIGNIYADEICFRASVRPDRRVSTLGDQDKKKIFQACHYIMNKAVKFGGTTFSDYRTADGNGGAYVKYLKVYGRAKQLCLKCKKTEIKKHKIAGRGTHFCPICQK
ncbi:MAG: bifunctional DNA-formamidopyrimidine glycosylase/DNA-(apurinic or apyrimidinic site) lyase [Patescibacteria group bacterium]|jgi:formamidopyrimidine-DNA glycosylase